MTSNPWPWVFWGVVAAVSGCGEDPEHPPEYKPSGDAAFGDPPRSCGQIREGQPSAGGIEVEGGKAACAASGMVCALSDVAAFAEWCDAGQALARCSSILVWELDCEPGAVTDAAVDAATPDASPLDASGTD